MLAGAFVLGNRFKLRSVYRMLTLLDCYKHRGSDGSNVEYSLENRQVNTSLLW
jgi:hypothetical protein